MYFLCKILILVALLGNGCNGQTPAEVMRGATAPTYRLVDSVVITTSYAPLDAAKRWGFGEKRPDYTDFSEVSTKKWMKYGNNPYTFTDIKGLIKSLHSINEKCGFYLYEARYGEAYKKGYKPMFQLCNPNFDDAKPFEHIN